MSTTPPEPPHFRGLFMAGGVLVALLGLALVLTGHHGMGLLVLAAALIAWIFVKRRERRAAG